MSPDIFKSMWVVTIVTQQSKFDKKKKKNASGFEETLQWHKNLQVKCSRRSEHIKIDYFIRTTSKIVPLSSNITTRWWLLSEIKILLPDPSAEMQAAIGRNFQKIALCYSTRYIFHSSNYHNSSHPF